jgi:hypothetical protein
MQEHPAVLLPYLIEVDVLIAPLLQECWRLGWHTRYSCQGGTVDWAYIAFRGSHAVQLSEAVLAVYKRWTHRLESNGEVIRFPQPGITKALQALKRVAGDSL